MQAESGSDTSHVTKRSWQWWHNKAKRVDTESETNKWNAQTDGDTTNCV